MKRREFIAALGGAAASSLLRQRPAYAQQGAMPVVGFLDPGAEGSDDYRTNSFRQGLKESGFVEGQNVTIEYRWAEGRYDRLPALAADLVHRQVTVIAASSTPAALAAKAATKDIPIVFETAADPVKLGLVASLRRPGGNITGVTQLAEEVAPKRLELLHEMLPTARVIALLVNPTISALAGPQVRLAQSAADALGVNLQVVEASTEAEFEAVFAKLEEIRAQGLLISGDAFFSSHHAQLAALALRHMMPAAYQHRDFAAAGGLLSYGSSITETHRLVGLYAGRILKGEKPADLPVQQSTKIELFINLKTVKTLGITVPITVLGRADEVIE